MSISRKAFKPKFPYVVPHFSSAVPPIFQHIPMDSPAHQHTLLQMHRYTPIYMGTDIRPYTVILAAMPDRIIDNEEHWPTPGDGVEGLCQIQERVVRGSLRKFLYYPPTVGAICWTGKPKSSMKDTDRVRLNSTDGPNTNRKRRPWIIIEELPDGRVRMMYASPNPSESIRPQGVLLRVLGLQQPKGRRVGRRLRRRIGSSSSPFTQRSRMVDRC